MTIIAIFFALFALVFSQERSMGSTDIADRNQQGKTEIETLLKTLSVDYKQFLRIRYSARI